jgi:predicted RNA-binding Zn-ribbon protein involved in translation (DUF1610 family)
MKKIKVIALFSKFAGNDNPYKAIIPFLLSVLLFVVTITPFYAQITTIAPPVYENQTNLEPTETGTATSMNSETPQSTAAFCPNCGNQLLKHERSCPFCNFNLSQWYQTTKK